MALHLTCRASRKGRGILHLRPSRRGLLPRLEQATNAVITDKALAQFLGSEALEEELRLGLYPLEEPLRFFFDEKEDLVCRARTSGGGPGYHAFVVDFLEVLGRKCGLTWEWTKADGEPGDETGYQGHRDFARLQEYMLDWLQETAHRVVSARNSGRQLRSIGLPAEALLPKASAKYDLCCPLGRLGIDWFIQVARKPIRYLGPYGESFFPWWHRERNAHFWRSLGLAQAWTRVPWHAPLNDTEVAEMELAREYFRRARELDPSIALPEQELLELGRLLGQTPETGGPPEPEGIGYRRQVVEMPIQHGWRVDLPGYYYVAREDNESAPVFWFGRRAVKASALSPWEADAIASTAEELLARVSAELPLDAEIIEETRGDALGKAALSLTEEEGQTRWALEGHWALESRACSLSISFCEDEDREWALETWRSVYHPAEGDGKTRRSPVLAGQRVHAG